MEESGRSSAGARRADEARASSAEQQDTGRAPASAATLRGWIAHHAAERGGHPYIERVDGAGALTYGELADRVGRLSAWLADEGVGAGDRVALLAGNSIEHLIAYLGVMAHGATICTVNVETYAPHLETILAALAPRVVLHDGDHAPGAGWHGPAGATARALGRWDGAGGGLYGDLVSGSATDARPCDSRPGDDACIYFTSGTTATPKGIVLTARELFENAPPTAEAFGIRPDDRLLDFRSFNWASAQILGALATLSAGATLLLARKFSRSRFFHWVRDHGATIATGNPTTINMLLNKPPGLTGADLPSLRFMTSSSAPLSAREWRDFEDRFAIKIAQGYGTSETGWIAGCTDATARHGSAGRPLAYHDIRIVNADGGACPAGEIGFVELGGHPGRAYRYLNADGTIDVWAEGRTRTGDLGYIDRDGYLFLTGREKDLIIRGGVNIAPAEIDGVLMELPEIAEAATIGVPDAIYGEEVVAWVVLRPGAAADAGRILDGCRGRLTPAKLPKQVLFAQALPKTPRGKLDRRALVERWHEPQLKSPE